MLSRIGRYVVQEQIGEGAMADVYRAFDPSINRTLAVKVLKPEFRQNREYAARFIREAKAAGALNHPNIVTIYDVGEVDGYPYIAMELIVGRALNEMQRERGKLPTEEVLRIGVQLAEALRYAHGLNVVHRDIKPSNIMMLEDGGIKILDFGIAHITEDEDDGLRTQIGQVLGSPRYMSPEQALGRDLDGRSDLFSVGVVLYELTSGRKAFSGVSPATLALQITQQEPSSLADVSSDTPRGLQFIINKLLAKRPDRRFRNGAQLAEALRREQAAHAAVEREAATRRRYLPLQARVTLLVVSITALALLSSITPVLQRQNAALQQLALTFGSATAAFVANNAALRAVDNATLPPEQRDWLPTQAFVQAASSDPRVRQLLVVDAAGVVRGANSPELAGRLYAPPAAEKVVQRSAQEAITLTADGQGYRVVRPITYAGRSFGKVDLVLSRTGLVAAANLSLLLMAVLALVTLASVGVASYIVARSLAAPIRRLKAALTDAAGGDLAFRISHHRRDEFGELFDAFNLMSSNLEERLGAAESYALESETERLPAHSPTSAAEDASSFGLDAEAQEVLEDGSPNPFSRPARNASAVFETERLQRARSPFDAPAYSASPRAVQTAQPLDEVDDAERTVIQLRDDLAPD